jgi:hypothetical protein
VLDTINKRRGIAMGTIKNGHSRNTNIIGHKTQNEDEQNNNYNRKTKKDEKQRPHKKQG